MNIITRFAPSPTGMLHIGGVRTALFNYLFSKNLGGKFLLRIEDTDKERSTKQSIDAILNGLKWIGIDYDGDPVYQSSRYDRHLELAKKMIENGYAYYAYDSKEELDEERKAAENKKQIYRYSGKWRDNKDLEPTKDNAVVRIKIPKGEKIIMNDLIKGNVEVNTDTLDDFVLIRSDSTPTYMMAVVVDDIDMGITHIIRGDDHLSNTPKQLLIYKALNAKSPEFAHIPLIHGDDGKKMSKRRAAVAIEDYKEMGFLPEAMFSYLAQLGCDYGTSDILKIEDVIKKFNIKNINTAAARFDLSKLKNINLHYIQNKSDNEIFDLIKNDISTKLNENDINIIMKIMPEVKKQHTLNDVINLATRFTSSYVVDQSIIENDKFVKETLAFLQNANYDNFKASLDDFLKENGIKMSQAGPLIRKILIGISDSIGVSQVIHALGKDEIYRRVLQFTS